MEDELVKMRVEIDNLTIPQAIALDAMFRMWQSLGGMGASRHVSYFVDGDGNFRPKIKSGFYQEIDGTDFPRNPYVGYDMHELHKLACIKNGDDIVYDFDPVAWHIHEGGKKLR